MSDKTKILVTGGCGFIGANLVPELLADGYQVRVLDNLSRGFESYLDLERVELHRGDIRDQEVVDVAMDGIDLVIHLAAYGSVVESIAEPDENFDINARGTLNVLKGAQRAGVKRVVFSSTGGAIMGDTPPPVDELSVPKPISPYGASKLCGEAYAYAFAGSYGLQVVVLRFGNIYGPWSAHKKGAVTVFAKALMTGETIRIFGDGSASRDFLHVSDLCDGIRKAMIQEGLDTLSVFHLASERETTVMELAEMMRELAGLPNHPIEYLPGRRGEVTRNFAACDKAHRVLGFTPRRDLKQGMDETWRWFLDNREEALAMETSDS